MWRPNHTIASGQTGSNSIIFIVSGRFFFLCLCEKQVDNNGGRSQTNIRCLCNNLLSGALSSPLGPALFIIFHPTGSYTILVDKPNILILFFVVVSAFFSFSLLAIIRLRRSRRCVETLREETSSVSVGNWWRKKNWASAQEELFCADGKIRIINEYCYYVRFRNCSPWAPSTVDVSSAAAWAFKIHL